MKNLSITIFCALLLTLIGFHSAAVFHVITNMIH